MKDGCGDTPSIAVCQLTTLQYEEEVFSKIKMSNDSGKTAMNYAKIIDLIKIIQNVD